MDTTTDSSVLMNLKDLFVMEADRRADEAAATERAKAEEAARLERERREQEEAIRMAREDERRRAQLELDAQNEAVEARIRTLRSQLDQVRQDREHTQLQVAALAAHTETPSRRGNWIVGTMAAMSLVAALSAVIVAWPQPVAPVDLPSAAVVDTAVELSEDQEGDVVAVTVAEPEDTSLANAEVELVETEVAPTPRPHGPRPHGPRPHGPRPHDPSHDLGSQLDFGNDDGLIPQ